MSTRRSHQYLKQLRRIAEQLGYSVTPTRGGHQCAKHWTGFRVIFASTSSSPRGFRNAVAMLRRTARQERVNHD